jgi:hypothetical protein
MSRVTTLVEGIPYIGIAWTAIIAAGILMAVLVILVVRVVRVRRKRRAAAKRDLIDTILRGMPHIPSDQVTDAKIQSDQVTGPPYTYAEYMRDIEGGVDLDVILAKCGGRFPEPPADYKGPTAPADVEWRLKERLAWFEQIRPTAPRLNLVNPPVPKPPVVAVQGMVVPCVCRGSGSLMYGMPDRANCRRCGGKGFVTVTRG